MSKDLFYLQLLAQEQELMETLEAIRKLKKHYNKFEATQQAIPFVEPQHNEVAITNKGDYDKEWIIKDKVFYALKCINQGTADEVANTLSKLDDEFSKSKAKRVSTNHLSRMFRANAIGASQTGKKYRYYIFDDQKNI